MQSPEMLEQSKRTMHVVEEESRRMQQFLVHWRELGRMGDVMSQGASRAN